MIVSNTDVKDLARAGAKVYKGDKPFFPKSTVDEVMLLKEIAYQLRLLNERETTEVPAPVVNVSPPEVIVNPPEVNVTVPPEPRPRKWEIEVSRNMNGDITHITATANG